MFEEEDLLPLSGLQHLLFCERQWALIHLESVWADNRYTVEGSHLHQTVDEAGARSELRGEIRVTRSLALASRRLGLSGKADVVEFHPDPSAPGGVRPFPVEYKRGKAKAGDEDRVQLCAQALCLEEMLRLEVPAGAIYYGQPRRRTEVVFDATLRATVEAAAARMHALFTARETPVVLRQKKCERCSLLPICQPPASAKSARAYLAAALAAAREGPP